MSNNAGQPSGPDGRRVRLAAAIFDVDGVLVASPHERAWRESLAGFADPVRFTTEFYQANVAGKPRLEGAREHKDLWGSPPEWQTAALPRPKASGGSPHESSCSPDPQ